MKITSISFCGGYTQHDHMLPGEEIFKPLIGSYSSMGSARKAIRDFVRPMTYIGPDRKRFAAKNVPIVMHADGVCVRV